MLRYNILIVLTWSQWISIGLLNFLHVGTMFVLSARFTLFRQMGLMKIHGGGVAIKKSLWRGISYTFLILSGFSRGSHRGLRGMSTPGTLLKETLLSKLWKYPMPFKPFQDTFLRVAISIFSWGPISTPMYDLLLKYYHTVGLLLYKCISINLWIFHFCHN